MDRLYRFRTGVVVALVLLVAVLYTGRLFALQLTSSEENAYGSSSTTTYLLPVSAARGEILDRHGTVLVSNRATYGVTLNSFVLFNADDPNGALLRLAEACRKNGIEYQDRLPLSDSAPYVYTTEERDYIFRKFMQGRGWDADMTAENLAKKLRNAYHIPNDCTDLEARLIMGLRYELDLPAYANAEIYTLTEDVSADQLAILKELAVPGMDVTTTTVREYNTQYAGQLLGYVRAMDAEQYEEIYEPLGYAMDAKVGQEGMEQGFEEYLHGTDGVKVVTVASDGTVLDEYWKVEPQSGANVISTIDIGLQELCEKALASHIQTVAETARLNNNADGYDASAGSVVVMNPQTGETLAAANYPTYPAGDYFKRYTELEEQDALRNRALIDANPPGSTFKPITAIAAMRAGIPATYTVDGQGYYTFEADGTTLGCWIVKQGGVHGILNMRQALAQSCNIYFYTVGLKTGITRIQDVAASVGIGQDPGSELYASSGQMASEEVKMKAYGGDEHAGRFYDADIATAAIGQSETRATPLQLCRYISAIGNGGTLYNATFLRRAVSSDFQTLVKGNDFTPVSTGIISPSEYQVVKEGMRMCVTEGTAQALSSYPVEVCAKTGTASHGSGGSDHGAFVCWAPADNPEIAIAIYVEHGASGSNFAGLAKDILDYYFNSQYPVQEISVENRMTED